MGTHKECGEEVRWVRRPDDMDKWMPPLEYVGHGYVIIDAGNGEQSATEMATYRPHHCDPEKMLLWQEYLVKLAQVKAKGEKLASRLGEGKSLPVPWEAVRERRDAIKAKFREEARLESILIPCSTCKSGINVPCYNLSIFKKTQEIVPTAMPHISRWTPSKGTS